MTHTMSDSFPTKVRDFIRTNGMLAPGMSVAVAFSGGADSVALLEFFHRYGAEYGITLCAVHVNHCLRGEESERDEAFCRQFCKARGIPLEVRRVDVAHLAAKSSQGVEECARGVRYGIFEELVESGFANAVATAHHAADNLETVLMALARGSALHGVCGIPPVRGCYIRPMLCCTKEEIHAFLGETGIGYVTDSTNTDTAYTRNRIRAQVLPTLEGVNEELYRHITEFCASAREDDEYLMGVAKKAKTDDISVLRTLDKAIMTRVLMLLWREQSSLSLSRSHILALCALVQGAEQGARLSLPGGVTAYIDRGRLCFSYDFCERVSFRYGLREGKNSFPQLDCDIFITEEKLSEDSLNIYKKSIHTCVNSDKISKMFIRERRDGDSYRALGVTRKIKKLIQQDKLDMEMRARLPIFCDDTGILWVPGHGVRDGAWSQDGVHIYYCYGVKTKCGET